MNAHEYLDQLKSEIKDTKDAVNVYFSSLNEEQLNWRPDENSWSIGECLKHLCIMGEMYLREIHGAVKRGYQKDLFGDEFKYSWFGKQFMKKMEPSAKSKFKSPSAFKPNDQRLSGEIVNEFLDFQDQLVKAMEDAKGLNLTKLKIKSPVFSLLKLRLGEAFELVITHQKRHLNQAQGVYKSLDFPKEASEEKEQ